MTVLRRFAMPIGLCAVIAAVAAYGFATVPDGARIPTHWGVSGHADGYSSKTVGLLLPLLTAVGITALLVVLPAIDPRRRNVEQSRKAIVAIAASLDLLMLAVLIIDIVTARGWSVDTSRVMPLGVGAMFAVLGNYLGKVRPNFFIGIRTPWTLSSDRVWSLTHRLCGRLFVAVGIATVFVALASPSAATVVLVAGGIGAGVTATVYSFVTFRREAAVDSS
jgi:uncharacterized membrane protein